MKLLDEPDLRAFEEHLARVIDRHLGDGGGDTPGLRNFNAAIRDYVLVGGGKRVRPQLTAWAYQIASGSRTLPCAVLDVAAGWELFHAFLLVHDDLIDASEARRDRPALHVTLRGIEPDGSGEDTELFGQNMAIVAGDLLYSAATCVWNGLEVEAPAHRALLRVFSKVACTTGFGQAIDILVARRPIGSIDEATLLREYGWKTAAYTFEGPMLCGAILAGLGEAAQAAISRYAMSLGQAYQLQNDLIDLVRPVSEGCDLAQGKRTIAILQHRARLTDAARTTFDGRLAAVRSLDAVERLRECSRLRTELLDGGALETGRETIDRLIEEARTATRDAALGRPMGNALMALLDALAAQYFIGITQAVG